MLQKNVSLKQLNTFGIDVNAKMYVPIYGVESLQKIYNDQTLKDIPKFILGGGSNILFTQNYDGLVLHMQNKGIVLDSQDKDYFFVKAQAGERWQDVVSWTLKNNMPALENLTDIPGTIGAAAVQNIGAYGAEASEFFKSLTYFDLEDGQVHTLNKTQCEFVYRGSIFKNSLKNKAVIVDVTLALPKQWTPNFKYGELKQLFASQENNEISAIQISQEVRKIRQQKIPDPKKQGNGGSFFKNPTVSREDFKLLKSQYPNMPAYEQITGEYRIAAGWLIDQCGLKGKSLGNAQVCPTQALVILNKNGQATGKEIARLSLLVAQEVNKKFGLSLEPETVII